MLYNQPDTSKATQSATIIDLNNHGDGSVKTAYYQVTASSCAQIAQRPSRSTRP